MFCVSVVIPVYNAVKYIERAILSALDQKEVKEVVVVDDGYQDGAYAICQQLAKQHSRIKLLTHPNHENKGAGTSRNLGILNASCDYIAFLDADDYFLPNRFQQTKKLFLENPHVDGIYEPVGTDFDSKKAKLNFSQMMKLSDDQLEHFITYPNERLEGFEFFESLILLNNGLPPLTDGITIKKSLIALVGLFNTNLRLHQDSEYWIRLSHKGYFSSPSNREVVAVRTMHDENRIYAKNIASKIIFYRALLAWASQAQLKQELYISILKTYQYLLNQQKNQSIL
jgi:glycosyltransferase involved in cell wall biosynthesis